MNASSTLILRPGRESTIDSMLHLNDAGRLRMGRATVHYFVQQNAMRIPAEASVSQPAKKTDKTRRSDKVIYSRRKADFHQPIMPKNQGWVWKWRDASEVGKVKKRATQNNHAKYVSDKFKKMKI